jgi:heme A synthase
VLDFLHRNTALVVLAVAILATYAIWKGGRDEPATRFWSGAVVALALFQVALGVVMAYVSLARVAQVLHLTVASLLLGAETVLCLLLRPAPGGIDERPAVILDA